MSDTAWLEERAYEFLGTARKIREADGDIIPLFFFVNGDKIEAVMMLQGPGSRERLEEGFWQAATMCSTLGSDAVIHMSDAWVSTPPKVEGDVDIESALKRLHEEGEFLMPSDDPAAKELISANIYTPDGTRMVGQTYKRLDDGSLEFEEPHAFGEGVDEWGGNLPELFRKAFTGEDMPISPMFSLDIVEKGKEVIGVTKPQDIGVETQAEMDMLIRFAFVRATADFFSQKTGHYVLAVPPG